MKVGARVRGDLARDRIDVLAVARLEIELGAHRERQLIREPQPIVAGLHRRLLPVRQPEVHVRGELLAERRQARKRRVTHVAREVVRARERRYRERVCDRCKVGAWREPRSRQEPAPKSPMHA